MEPVTLGLVLVFIGFLLWFFSSSSHAGKKLPPGPSGLPLVGSLFEFDSAHPYRTFMKWHKQFGEVVMVKNGTDRLVMLNTYRAMKEAFVVQGNVFSGRPNVPYLKMLCHDSGIIFTDGDKWQESRRFVLRVLRDFGLGRTLSEDIVVSELELLRQHLSSQAEQPLDIRHILVRTICNVVSRLSLGERCGSETEDFERMMHSLDDITSKQNLFTLLPSLFPIITRIPPLLALVEKLNSFRASIDFCHDFARRKMQEHMTELGDGVGSMDSSQARDVCDAMLIEKAKQDRQNPEKNMYTEWQIIRNVIELFVAGTETTTSTLSFALFFMATNLEVQAKVHTEIDTVVGSNRNPCMKDRPEMHFSNAVLDETSRLASIAPLNVPHRTLQDTELLGFFIPKDMVVTSNLYGIHHDPELWERPDQFYPQHFLTSDGRYKASENLAPFSIGKRACLGETLARMELYLFFVGIMQSFSVRLDDPKADIETIGKGVAGFTRVPGPHKIVFSKRET